MGKKSPHTYLLDDGRIWNASHLSALPEMNNAMDNARELVDSQPETHAQPGSIEQSRPNRQRNLPTWTKDYVLD